MTAYTPTLQSVTVRQSPLSFATSVSVLIPSGVRTFGSLPLTFLISSFNSGMGFTRSSDVLKKNFSESGIIARFGGDEFVVLTNMKSVDDVSSMIRKTADDLRSFRLPEADKEGREFSISFSSGAARFPYDAGGFSLLKKHADTALYEVKERGRNGYLWYMDLGKKPE